MKLRTHKRQQFSQLVRRFGLLNKRSVTLAATIFVLLAAAVGVLLALRPHPVLVTSPQETPSTDAQATRAVSLAASQATSASHPDTSSQQTPQPPVKTLVHVDGAITNPGVVELEVADPRVQDAINACGGLTEGADTSMINLAAKVSDGTKIYIPRQGEQLPSQLLTAPQSTSVAPNPSVSNASQAPEGSIVNLNTATAEELQTLPGVGASTAQKILSDRSSNGPFSTPEDLMRVSGIGEKKFAKLKDRICV